jgi:CRP/FNR family transcriptional regulator, cyclic AMP receptor protein
MPKKPEDPVLGMLRSVSLFSGLEDKQLKSIQSSGKELDFEAGRLIVKEGDSGLGFYLILDGSVEVRHGGKVLAKLGKGEFFGEMTLLDNMPRSADVVAVSKTKCFGLTPWAFAGTLKTDPSIALKMMKELVGRLRTSLKSAAE